MKKTTKGIIALAAAAALLAGGGGTLAYWNAVDEVPGGTFTAGLLTLDAANCDAAGWTVSNTIEGVTDAAFDPATETIVPGDVLTKTCTVTVNAEGTNLRATLDVTAPAIGPGAPAMPASAYTVSGDFELGGAALDEITDANDGDTIDVEIVVGFPIGGAVDNTTQTTVIDLDAFTVTATQVNA